MISNTKLRQEKTENIVNNVGAFSSRASLQKHIKLKHSTPSFLCHECGQEYPRKDYFERHKCARPPTKIKTRVNVEEEVVTPRRFAYKIEARKN